VKGKGKGKAKAKAGEKKEKKPKADKEKKEEGDDAPKAADGEVKEDAAVAKEETPEAAA